MTLLIYIMISLGTMNTYTDAKIISYVNPDTPGVVKSQNNNLDKITDASIIEVKEKVHKVESTKIIAWALKSDNLDVPPRLFEEVIVCIKWLDKKKAPMWTLSYISRFTNSTGSSDRQWRLSFNVPPFIASKEYVKTPTTPDLINFIKETNFGYNEFSPVLDILKVVSYRDSKDILCILEQGISEEEKAKRNEKYLKIISTPEPDF